MLAGARRGARRLVEGASASASQRSWRRPALTGGRWRCCAAAQSRIARRADARSSGCRYLPGILLRRSTLAWPVWPPLRVTRPRPRRDRALRLDLREVVLHHELDAKLHRAHSSPASAPLSLSLSLWGHPSRSRRHLLALGQQHGHERRRDVVLLVERCRGRGPSRPRGPRRTARCFRFFGSTFTVSVCPMMVGLFSLSWPRVSNDVGAVRRQRKKSSCLSRGHSGHALPGWSATGCSLPADRWCPCAPSPESAASPPR